MFVSNTSSFFSLTDVQALKDLLASPRKIFITMHRKPDGDALGSTLGLGLFLQQAGHDVKVVSPTPYDHFLAWLPGAAEIVNAEQEPHRAKALVEEADLIFCLDFSALSRLENMEGIVRAASGVKIMVDHHADPEGFASLDFHRVSASSTAELVFRLIEDLEGRASITRDIAINLYTGIMMDTGSFRFSSTTSDVHSIVAYLLDTGLDVGEIHARIFNNFSALRMRFLGYLLNEKLRVLPEYNTAYMIVTLEEKRRFRVQQGDTEGIVNYNLGIRGINFGVMMIEAEDKIKLSFRSTGSFPCNVFAANFSGGGHHNASGGKSTESLDATEEKFLNLLEQYKSQLNY